MATQIAAPRPVTPPVATRDGIGGNRPDPSRDAVADFEDSLRQRDGFEKRCVDLIGSAERAIATDNETVGRCGELVKQITAVERVIEDARKTVKEPYLQAGRAVDDVAKSRAGPLSDAKRRVSGKMDTFMREEQARRAAIARREEEERRAQEAGERAKAEAVRIAQGEDEPETGALDPTPIFTPPVAAPEPTRVRGDFGSLTSARMVWLHQVTDYDVAYMAVSDNENVRAAIDKAVGALVRGGVRKIEGVHVYSDVKAQVR